MGSAVVQHHSQALHLHELLVLILMYISFSFWFPCSSFGSPSRLLSSPAFLIAITNRLGSSLINSPTHTPGQRQNIPLNMYIVFRIYLLIYCFRTPCFACFPLSNSTVPSLRCSGTKSLAVSNRHPCSNSWNEILVFASRSTFPIAMFGMCRSLAGTRHLSEAHNNTTNSLIMECGDRSSGSWSYS